MLILITLINVLRESHRWIITVSFLVQSGSDGSLWHLCYYCVGHSFYVFITGPGVWLCANKSLSSVHISLCSHDHMHMTCWSVLAVHQVRQDNWGKLTEQKHWETMLQPNYPHLESWTQVHIHTPSRPTTYYYSRPDFTKLQQDTHTHTYHTIQGLVLVNDRQKYSVSFLKTGITKN